MPSITTRQPDEFQSPRSHRTHGEIRHAHDVLPRGGSVRRTVDRIRARLAGARDQLATSVACVRRARFSRDRAGHARLWPLVGVSHARRVCVAGSIVGDMIGLIDSLGRERAVWVGHDWGSPVVWSIASHHPERCAAVANLCVPYYTLERGLEAVPRPDRPEALSGGSVPGRAVGVPAALPGGFRRRDAGNGFESVQPREAAVPQRRPERLWSSRRERRWSGATTAGSVAATFRRCRAMPTSSPRRTCSAYASALTRNGFFGPNSYYMNHARECGLRGARRERRLSRHAGAVHRRAIRLHV